MKRKISEEEFDFGIYEVYYDDEGNFIGSTGSSMTPTTDSPEGLMEEFEIMKRAFTLSILDYKENTK